MNPERQRNRVTPDGQEIGARIASMTDIEVSKLIAAGEWSKDERCKSCAFRAGTVPNGCIQTQADALKCVMEKTTFGCHVEGHGTGVCMGWFAAMQFGGGPLKREAAACPWPFSRPDEGEASDHLTPSTTPEGQAAIISDDNNLKP